MSVGTQILALLGLTAVAASAALLCARPLVAALEGALKKWRRMGLVPRVVAVMMAAVATVEAQKGGMGEVNRAERVDAQLGLLSSTENSTLITPVAADSTGFLLPDSFSDVTNLCFWGIEPGLHSVALGIAWPEWMTFVNDRIDIYGNYELKTNGWSHLAQVDVSQVLTNLIVEFNYEDFPTNAMRKSAFFRLAPQDDSDDDGLSDKAEEWVLGTNPVLPDTDNDGLPDGDELALKTDPRAKDCDSDGIEDGNEGGCLRVSDAFLWHDTSSLSPWYNTGYWYEDIGMGISSWWCTVASWPIYSTHVLNGLTLNYLTAYETGYIAFSTPEDSNYWIFPPGPTALNNDIWNSGSIMVAAYWNDSYLYKGNTNSYIKAGIVADGTYVVEFHDVKTAPYSTMGMTYQVSIPSGTGNVIRVSYLSSDYWLNGEGAVVGIQNKRIVTTNGYYNLTWNFQERGPILPRTTIEYHLGYGTSPLNDDTDGDGFDDLFELTVSLSSPLSDDGDDDGLSDVVEYSLGTNPNSADSDGDLLPDKWEVDSGLNPLSAIGEDGRTGDSDGDGLSNYREYSFGTSPKNSDSDGDEIDDSAEVELKTNPLSKDSDNDGIDDGVELSIGTNPLKSDSDNDGLIDSLEVFLGINPLQPDSDSDGMDDGWEYRYIEAGFDPSVNNAADGNPGNDLDSDMDGDGLSNAQECEWGTLPNGRDTDGDGVEDRVEISQNSDPTDAGDEGKPNSRVSVSFLFGDHSSSHSEKYRLEITPVAGVGEPPKGFVWLNENYGQCEARTSMLKPGWKYEVKLYHAGSNISGDIGPDFDYSLECISDDLPRNVVVSDPQSLLGTYDTDSSFAGEGKTATISIHAITDITICEPGNSAWDELDEARVVLDDEDLRIKMRISPQIQSLSQCRDMFGDSLIISTSGTCPNGASLPISNDAMLINLSGESEIRISKTRQQLESLGLLPSKDEDGVNEMAWMDMANLSSGSGQSLLDSEAFAGLGYADRGRASLDFTQNINSNPPKSTPSESYFKAAGREVVNVSYDGRVSESKQIMNQSDWFYFSGHGNHATGTIQGGFTPSMALQYWGRDLDCAIIAGCAVLDVRNYRFNSLGLLYRWKHKDWKGVYPGEIWEGVGVKYLLGYALKAPLDADGGDAITTAFIAHIKSGKDIITSWRDANNTAKGRNACVIDCSKTPHQFWFWDESSGSPIWTKKVKGSASW